MRPLNDFARPLVSYNDLGCVLNDVVAANHRFALRSFIARPLNICARPHDSYSDYGCVLEDVYTPVFKAFRRRNSSFLVRRDRYV